MLSSCQVSGLQLLSQLSEQRRGTILLPLPIRIFRDRAAVLMMVVVNLPRAVLLLLQVLLEGRKVGLRRREIARLQVLSELRYRLRDGIAVLRAALRTRRSRSRGRLLLPGK